MPYKTRVPFNIWFYTVRSFGTRVETKTYGERTLFKEIK